MGSQLQLTVDCEGQVSAGSKAGTAPLVRGAVLLSIPRALLLSCETAADDPFVAGMVRALNQRDELGEVFLRYHLNFRSLVPDY